MPVSATSKGKETNPGRAVLDALAAALALDEDAYAHLYALAGHALDAVRRSGARSSLPSVPACACWWRICAPAPPTC